MISSIRHPTRKEVDLYYKTHRSKFQAPERAHVLHIVKNAADWKDRETAHQALEAAVIEIGSGTSFSEVADRYSDCAGNGGDLGWVLRGVMVEEFEDVVFEMSPGQVSSIFETPFGLHIAKLLDKRPAGIRPLSEVYDQISDGIYQNRLRQAQLQ